MLPQATTPKLYSSTALQTPWRSKSASERAAESRLRSQYWTVEVMYAPSRAEGLLRFTLCASTRMRGPHVEGSCRAKTRPQGLTPCCGASSTTLQPLHGCGPVKWVSKRATMERRGRRRYAELGGYPVVNVRGSCLLANYKSGILFCYVEV